MSLSDIAAVTRGNDDGDGWGGNIRTSTLMRADAEPRSKLLPSIFGSLGRRGRKSSPPGVKGAHNGC